MGLARPTESDYLLPVDTFVKYIAKLINTALSANKLATILDYYTVLKHNTTFSNKKNHGHCRTQPQLNSP